MSFKDTFENKDTEAFGRGYDDQINGEDREKNPYPENTKEHEDWLDGYDCAWVEDYP